MIDFVNKDLYLQNSIDKQLKIKTSDNAVVITNTQLHSESFTLDESICSDSTLVLGSCESSCVTFTYSTDSLISLVDKWVTITQTLNGDTDNVFNLGKFKVVEDIPSADRKNRSIKAYDALYDVIKTDVSSWYKGLTFPMTLKAFRDSFFAHFGITQVTATLPNDNMSITKTIDPQTLTGKTVLSAICEINGCFGHIDRDGKFKYIFLTELTNGLVPSNDLYPSNNLYPADFGGIKIARSSYIDCDYEDFKTERIDGITINKEDNDVGVSVGGTNNVYTIKGNFLTYGIAETTLREIAGKVLNCASVISYVPIKSSTCVGNPCLEVGDSIRFNTNKAIVQSYILQRTLSGIQSLKDSYTSNGTVKVEDKSNSLYDSITDLKGKTNVLTRSIDETKSQIDDVEQSLSSEISQTASQISLKVSKGDVCSEINQSSDTITLNSNRLIVNSTNFKLDSSGNVQATSATLKETVTFSDNTGSASGTIEEKLDGNRSAMYIDSPYVYVSGTHVGISSTDGVSLSNGATVSGDLYVTGTAYKGSKTSAIKQQFATLDDIPDSVSYAKNAGYATSAGSAGSASSATNATYAYKLESASGGYQAWVKNDNKFAPGSTNQMQCGSGSYKWSEVYAGTGTINTSDRNEKKEIKPISDKLMAMFELLIPVSYQFIDGRSGRTHIGFISQDVEEAMSKVGLTDLDFAGFCRDIKEEYYIDEEGNEQVRQVLDEEGNPIYIYSLRYSEFIALNTQMIQKANEKIQALEKKYEDLESKINTLLSNK